MHAIHYNGTLLELCSSLDSIPSVHSQRTVILPLQTHGTCFSSKNKLVRGDCTRTDSCDREASSRIWCIRNYLCMLSTTTEHFLNYAPALIQSPVSIPKELSASHCRHMARASAQKTSSYMEIVPAAIGKRAAEYGVSVTIYACYPLQRGDCTGTDSCDREASSRIWCIRNYLCMLSTTTEHFLKGHP